MIEYRIHLFVQSTCFIIAKYKFQGKKCDRCMHLSAVLEENEDFDTDEIMVEEITGIGPSHFGANEIDLDIDEDDEEENADENSEGSLFPYLMNIVLYKH